MGKFEKQTPKRTPRAARGERSESAGKFARTSQRTERKNNKNRLPLIFGISAAAVLVIVFVVGFFALKSGMEEIKLEQNHIVENAHVVGVNIGGVGTLISSLASLITFREYVKHNPGKSGSYIKKFTVYNFAFLMILTIICM